MATAAQTCARIVTALEDFAAQEAAAIQTRDFEAAIAIQDRAAPLVEHLVAHATAIVEPRLQARIVELHVRRNRSSECLAEQIDQARTELQQTHAVKRRVAQIAPAYGYGKPAGRRTSLAAMG